MVAVTPGKSFVASFTWASVTVVSGIVDSVVLGADTVSVLVVVFTSLSFSFPLQDNTNSPVEKMSNSTDPFIVRNNIDEVLNVIKYMLWF
jgi:hypothetical protein